MKKIMVILACAVLTGSTLFAQNSQKIGWIESAELLQSMPEKAIADSALAKYQRGLQSQIETMMKDYQTKVGDYQSGEKKMTDAMKEIRGKEIQDLQTRIESMQQGAQEKLAQKKQDVYQPILDKADKTIKEVAKEKKYDYVIDKSGGSLLVGKEEDNLLPFVKTKLGIK